MRCWLKLPLCATVALLLSLACWQYATYFSLWEQLESASIPHSGSEIAVRTAEAKAFVLNVGTVGAERPRLLKGFVRADQHYHYRQDVGPLIHCEGYYGRQGGFDVYSVFRLNNETFSLFDDGSGLALKREYAK